MLTPHELNEWGTVLSWFSRTKQNSFHKVSWKTLIFTLRKSTCESVTSFVGREQIGICHTFAGDLANSPISPKSPPSKGALLSSHLHLPHNLSVGMSLPSPIPYALQTRSPSSMYSTLLSWLIPSIFEDSTFGTWTVSHNATLTPGTPPEETIASLICSGVSISFPALRWILIWAFIAAAFRSHAALPPCGSEKSRRLILTPSSWPRAAAQTRVVPQW